MLISFALRISMDCSACRISIPINGIVAFSRCYHCGENNLVNGRIWERRYLDEDAFVRAETDASGLSDLHEATLEAAIASRGQDLNLPAKDVRIAFGRQEPGCPKCGQSVFAAAVQPQALTTGVACPRCNTHVSVRKADELALYIHPGARLTIGERSAPEDASLHAQTHPVMFQCMSCGGALRVDGSSRVVTCSYCKGDNFLPDGLWQTLHPVPKPETFYLVCEIYGVQERAARASRSDLSVDEYRQLAADQSQEVCAAVAANPHVPHEILKQLAFNPHRTVLEALARNPGLPPDIVESMARSSDAEFRSLAAMSPALSHATLRDLLDDRSPAVQQAAHARAEQLRAQGVEVSGFFARLFGR